MFASDGSEEMLFRSWDLRRPLRIVHNDSDLEDIST